MFDLDNDGDLFVDEEEELSAFCERLKLLKRFMKLDLLEVEFGLAIDSLRTLLRLTSLGRFCTVSSSDEF